VNLTKHPLRYYEGLRRYPLVYYYYSRRPYRAMPYVFHMVGGLVVAHRSWSPQIISR
jgi:hypothetical protein